jgi:hypothetical protein
MPYLESETYRTCCGDNAARLFQEQFRAGDIYCRMADFLEEAARGRSVNNSQRTREQQENKRGREQ